MSKRYSMLQRACLLARCASCWVRCNACAGQQRNASLSRESSWCNPLLNPLPKAPSMSIYCFGSRDRPTEIAYLMKDQTGQVRSERWSRPISTVIANASGIKLLETTKGDGTIPWLSQTLMCSDEEAHGLRGWKGNPDLNPSEVQVRQCSPLFLWRLLSAPRRRK